MSVTAGRIAMTVVALSNSISCYLADFNHTHVYNPNWPPHARFHNGQTMSLGLTLGLLTQYYIWRPVFNATINPVDSTFSAALVGTLYWVCGMSAALYPGAKWMDPEFGEGIGAQAVIFPVHAAVLWAGYLMVIRGLKASKSA